jgi:DNA-directed RNA polymerase specialized sigma24 family protein
MADSPSFCQHPGDPEGCGQGLVAAREHLRLAEHCVMEGLRHNCEACCNILVKGLYDDKAEAEGGDCGAEDLSVDPEAYKATCQTAVLIGYEKGFGGAKRVFVQAYHRLVRYVVAKFGLTESSIPSADDVYQDVFLGLHKHLSKGASVDPGMLGAYVRQAAVHACFRAKKSEASRPEAMSEVSGGGTGRRVWPSGTVQRPILEADDIEAWEQLDWQLSRTDQGDLVNRLILAHKCMRGQRRGEKLPVKEMMADWQHLAERPEDELKQIYGVVATTSQGQVWASVPVMAAYLINAGHIQPWQLPVVFAAATDVPIDETDAFLRRLTDLSEEAVYARISRLKAALAPPSVGKGEQPVGE